MNRYTDLPNKYRTEFNLFYTKEYILSRYKSINDACEQNPTYFAYFRLGVKLRDYQIYAMEELLNDRFVFYLWSRRLGKTTLYIIYSLWAMVYNKHPQGMDNSTKILVMAHTVDGAERFPAELYTLIESGDRRIEQLFGKKRYFSSRLPRKNRDRSKSNQSIVMLKANDGTWSRMATFAPTMKARGEPASIVINDEIAFWCDYASDDVKIYNQVVRPIITDNPKSKIFSATTPNGETGLAYDLLNPPDGNSLYKCVWFPYYIRQDADYLADMERTKKEYEAKGEHEAFRQEYLAEFISKSDSYFKVEGHIDKVFDNITLQRHLSYFGECQVGIDFGGSKNSKTVITVSKYDKYSNIIYRLYDKVYPVGEDSTLQQDLLHIYKTFPNITKFHVDSQGGGSSFYSWFNKTFGASMIDEVVFKAMKTDMYTQFRIACYQNRIKSYFDPELRREMVSFTNDLKPTKGETDDRIDSFVLSCLDWIGNKENSKLTVIRY